MSFEFDRSPLRTGIDALDRELDGGLPAGSVVAYAAPPASQSELLLYELTAARRTVYLTTDRTEQAVADAIGRAACPTGDPDIHRVPADAPLQHTLQLVHQVDDEANVVVDPVDALERVERTRFATFLNELQNHMVNTGSVAVLHCLRSETSPELRSTTYHMADVVLEITLTYDGAEVETRLAVPKYRGGGALDRTIKLELAERVRVDTSRDIA